MQLCSEQRLYKYKREKEKRDLNSAGRKKTFFILWNTIESIQKQNDIMILI